VSQLVTGEAVALEQRVARLGSRLVAAVIDLAVQLAAFVALLIALTPLGEELDEAAAAALNLVLFLTIYLGYPVTFESLWRGRTLGKAAMGLQVVRDDGGPIRFRHALVRGLVGVTVERPGFTLGLGAVITSLASERSKRLGDLAAGTIVVQRRVPVRHSRGVYMPPYLIPWAQSLDLSRLSDDLALAARQFIDRAAQMTPASREQLGRSIVGAVVAAVTPPPPAQASGWDILSAVLAERRRREELRLYQQRPAYAAPAYGAPAPVAGGGPGGWGGPSGGVPHLGTPVTPGRGPAPSWVAPPTPATWPSGPPVGPGPQVGAPPYVSPEPHVGPAPYVAPGPVVGPAPEVGEGRGAPESGDGSTAPPGGRPPVQHEPAAPPGPPPVPPPPVPPLPAPAPSPVDGGFAPPM
jgi:uncharacterized RDD family membrane protein YckC